VPSDFAVKTGFGERKELVVKRIIWNRIPVKIILIFIALLLPLGVLMLYSTSNFVQTLENNVLENVHSLLVLNSNNMEQEISRTNYFLYRTMEWDTDYLGLVYEDTDELNPVKLSSFSGKIQNQLTEVQYNQALFFYLPNKSYLLLKGSSALSDELESLKTTLTRESLEELQTRWKITRINGRIYYMHATPYLDTYIDAFVDVSDMLETICTQLNYDDFRVELGKLPAKSDKSYIVASTELNPTGYYINIYISEKEVLGSLPIITRLLKIAVAAILLLIPVLLLVFWHIVVKPLNRIDAALVYMGKDPEYRITPFAASDEYMNLQNSLNLMADKIQALKIEGYEKELGFERMKTVNLMMQIRPHFLLNAFNQIYSMAQLEDYESIQTMSMYLTKYFRYLFNLKHLVALREELWLVRAFLDSMEICYIGCFTVEWDVDETLMEYQIPPLLLHNFVENIFKYAVAEGTETAIEIRIQKSQEDSEMAVITVTDDGPGIDEDILKKIQDGEPVEKSDGKHIGIWNSAYRLKTFLGEKSKLEISSTLTEGTRVCIFLPKCVEE
jgi:sensor histidine kinase YesM